MFTGNHPFTEISATDNPNSPFLPRRKQALPADAVRQGAVADIHLLILLMNEGESSLNQKLLPHFSFFSFIFRQFLLYFFK